MVCALAGILGNISCAGAAQVARPLSDDQRRQMETGLAELHSAQLQIHDRSDTDLADVEIFHKAVVWALRYDSEFTDADVTLLNRAISRGLQRCKELASGGRSWSAEGRGKQVLGYKSRVDDSVQPYGLIIPLGYDRSRPTRLDVVLHGSTRPVGMSELRFMSRFDDTDRAIPDQPFIELHPLGRVENCYRWAGETDVFEAIADACGRFNIDRDRIVLRGMSMGASGTWHLGLKHPDRFVALGPYCGYVDTHRFSETPLANFVRVGPLPDHQERGLHMLDSIDYAANAAVVPVIACMGENDVFFQAHVLMGEAFDREGLKLTNLISPGTGHVIDPVTHGEQMRRIGEIADAGINRHPRQLRFVTWTLKYNRCHWIELLGLGRHYARAEISARVADGCLEITEPRNITRFAVKWSELPEATTSLRVGRTAIELPEWLTAESPQLVLEQSENSWRIAGERVTSTGKRPGAQGPIDDAFTLPFLCVRGTGQPWNDAVHACALASLDRFAEEWQHYFRGVLPMKDDKDVTEAEAQTKNLILFGDPGSNRWIARVRPQLPIEWTRETIQIGGATYSASDHLPALIAPSPFSSEPHYIVLNSGHTFREAELAKLNYLLFPRWGDWAILKIEPPVVRAAETVVSAGYFDEQWRADAPSNRQ